MVCDRRKFPKAEMLPLTREEMISLLKGMVHRALVWHVETGFILMNWLCRIKSR